jgi:hypothetical protein
MRRKHFYAQLIEMMAQLWKLEFTMSGLLMPAHDGVPVVYEIITISLAIKQRFISYRCVSSFFSAMLGRQLVKSNHEIRYLLCSMLKGSQSRMGDGLVMIIVGIYFTDAYPREKVCYLADYRQADKAELDSGSSYSSILIDILGIALSSM